MYIILKIAIFVSGIWAAYLPAVYGALSIFYVDSSAIIDLLVVGSCIIIVWDTFRASPRIILLTSFMVLLIATTIGFFHYFRDSGASGPLPYEWLNGYYEHTVPFIILSLLMFFLRQRFENSKEDRRT